MQDISFIYLVPVVTLIWVVHSEKGVLTGEYTDGSGKKFKAVEECATDRAHWRDENIKCQSQAKTSRFHCLEANMKAYKSVKYVEICDEPIMIKQGHYPIFNGSGIQSKECTAETFQDYDALSSETLYFKCLHDKTKIYSEGQLECGEVASTTEDRMFTCDYKNYYWFKDPDHRKTGNTKCYSGLNVYCTQVPEKDCSRETHELDPDFKCVWKCKDEETRIDKPPYDCIRQNLSSVAPEKTTTYILERSTMPNPNGEEPKVEREEAEDDHKTITVILCSIFIPIAAIFTIVYLIVRCKRLKSSPFDSQIVRCRRGKNCSFDSPCCRRQINPQSTHEKDSRDFEMTNLEAKVKEEIPGTKSRVGPRIDSAELAKFLSVNLLSNKQNWRFCLRDIIGPNANAIVYEMKENYPLDVKEQLFRSVIKWTEDASRRVEANNILHCLIKHSYEGAAENFKIQFKEFLSLSEHQDEGRSEKK